MIKPLTSFRFFASLAVFLSHLTLFSQFGKTKDIYNNIFKEGYIGVTFFFVLSGFILAYTYFNFFKTINKEKAYQFYTARFSRIYPVYFLTFLISIPLVLIFSRDILQNSLNAILNLLMIQSFFPVESIYFSFNGPGWSLSNEMFFYLLLPFILVFLNKKKRFFTTKILTGTMLVIWAVSLVFVFSLNNGSNDHWLFYIFPLFRFADFLIGVLLGILFLNVNSQPRANSKTKFTFFEVGSLLLLVASFYFSGSIPQSFRYGIYYLPFMVLVIWVFSFQSGNLSKMLSNKILLHLGEISFSFYLIHQLVIRYLHGLPYLDSYPIPFALIAFSISLMASHLIYTLYENPQRTRLKNTFKKRLFKDNKDKAA